MELSSFETLPQGGLTRIEKYRIYSHFRRGRTVPVTMAPRETVPPHDENYFTRFGETSRSLTISHGSERDRAVSYSPHPIALTCVHMYAYLHQGRAPRRPRLLLLRPEVVVLANAVQACLVRGREPRRRSPRRPHGHKVPVVVGVLSDHALGLHTRWCVAWYLSHSLLRWVFSSFEAVADTMVRRATLMPVSSESAVSLCGAVCISHPG